VWTELLDTIARFHTAEALNRHAQRLAASQLDDEHAVGGEVLGWHVT